VVYLVIINLHSIDLHNSSSNDDNNLILKINNKLALYDILTSSIAGITRQV